MKACLDKLLEGAPDDTVGACIGAATKNEAVPGSMLPYVCS